MSTRAQETDGPDRTTPAAADTGVDARRPGAHTFRAGSGAGDVDAGRSEPADKYGDRNHTIDADEDDWAWRAKIRANPTTRLIYRVAIGVVGLAVVVLGVVLLPAPGPGWLVIFAGLGLWSTEFEWAHRLLDFAKSHVRRWTRWLGTQPLWVKALVGLGCLVLVLAAFYLVFLLTGVPSWIPTFAQDFLRGLPGVS